jgi:hypothetical protein
MGSLFLAERSFRLADIPLAERCVSTVKKCASFEARSAAYRLLFGDLNRDDLFLIFSPAQLERPVSSWALEQISALTKSWLSEWRGALKALEAEWEWLHHFLTEPMVRIDHTASERRRVLLKLTNALYRLLTRILAARRRTRTFDALIVHILSRLHRATPPEKKLLATSSSSATNPFWRQTCVLSPGMSGLRLAPI